MTKNQSLLPAELKGKFPPLELSMVDGRTFWVVFGVGISLFVVTMAAWRAPSAPPVIICMSFAGTILGPITATLILIFLPIQPYRDSWKAKAGGMINKDKRDPAAKRLVEIFASARARQFTLRAELKLSLVLLVATTIILAVFQGAGLHGHRQGMRPRDIFVMVYGMCWIGSFIALKVEVMAWAFRNWDSFAKSEGPFQLGR